VAGKWHGGAANRTWGRQGYRAPLIPDDLARGRRLAALLASERFWCEICGACHPLQEHRTCRTEYVTNTLPEGPGLPPDQA
jgi:hypothetical protein